jgi:hypothetical protein
MNLMQAVSVFMLYLVGLTGSIFWSVSCGGDYLLGLLLWTSFYAFSCAIGWSIWWSRREWFT